MQGAYTDDDTDIEFVTLAAVKEHGLGLNYAEIQRILPSPTILAPFCLISSIR